MRRDTAWSKNVSHQMWVEQQLPFSQTEEEAGSGTSLKCLSLASRRTVSCIGCLESRAADGQWPLRGPFTALCWVLVSDTTPDEHCGEEPGILILFRFPLWNGFFDRLVKKKSQNRTGCFTAPDWSWSRLCDVVCISGFLNQKRSAGRRASVLLPAVRLGFLFLVRRETRTTESG